MIQIPKYSTNGQPMTFYHVTSDTEKKEISRRDFFKLVQNTPNGEEHVLPDFDAGITYFLPDSEHCAEMSRTFCKEADAQRKQYVRHHECPLTGTPQCDGWTDNPNREHRCDACTNKNTCRTISLNTTMEDEEGNEIEYGSTIEDELSESVEEIAEKHSNLALLRTAVSCLTEEDQKYIRDCYGNDLDFVKLAEMYGIDRHYASKRAGRIENRLRKIIKEI